MTGAQASCLKTLSEQAHQPDAYEPNLTKAEASKRIDALKQLIKPLSRMPEVAAAKDEALVQG